MIRSNQKLQTGRNRVELTLNKIEWSWYHLSSAIVQKLIIGRMTLKQIRVVG